MTNKIYEIKDEEFRQLVKSSYNIKDILFKLGYSTIHNSWGYTMVKRRMDELHLRTTDFKGRSSTQKTTTVNKNKLFSSNSKHSKNVLRKFILKENLLEYKCAICGISHWNDKTLSLELDHINGVNNDNRLENLRWLCPNCYSQTSTYGSKNIKTEHIITDELRKNIQDCYNKTKNITRVAKELQIKKDIVKEVINTSKTNQKYVIRYDKDNNELRRYSSIAEACQSLINNREVQTKSYKTCRATFLRNCDKFWLNSYWKILDA